MSELMVPFTLLCLKLRDSIPQHSWWFSGWVGSAGVEISPNYTNEVQVPQRDMEMRHIV